METVEEPPLHNTPVDIMKVSVNNDEKSEENAVSSKESDVCHKPNGVSESGEAATLEPSTVTEEDSNANPVSEVNEVVNDANGHKLTNSADPVTVDTVAVETSQSNEASEASNTVDIKKVADEEEIEEIVIDATVDQVTFQTEIVVESNDGEIGGIVSDESKIEQDSNNILSELGESIELSEALRSSDVTDNAENNNCSARQEVFNKEELLDILEGNNESQLEFVVNEFTPSDKILETQLALQQLSRLKTKPKKSRSIERLPRKKKQKIIVQNKVNVPASKDKHKDKEAEPVAAEKEDSVVKVEGNLVNELVKDWDDDGEVEKGNNVVEANDKSNSDSLNVQETASQQGTADTTDRTPADSQTADGTTQSSSKSGDEGQPQRRFGRVIKKKVIFDPDNPDTFTKSKPINKSKENLQEKDQTPVKKIKPDPALQRAKSKSPLSKLQWKKPSPKNLKQHKRLSEVDKLLMDEGAVNMIYQLTPEAPKGRNNVKTKAEFIKKLQSSSTPDTKEMKFRERKKEAKYEEGEPRKILGGKQRPSLSSSVKSPCVSEDFEAHSADDSIIYRRHSSSSYSSSCMSPRRMSDVESLSQNAPNPPPSVTRHEVSSEITTVDMFLPENSEITGTEIINKDDCLSIKEKLNSKLNLALKKRKRDNTKTDKPLKLKRVKSEQSNVTNEDYKYLTITVHDSLAVICIDKSPAICNIEMINETERAFKQVNTNSNISVTLLLPVSGTAFSDLDLKSLLDENIEKRINYANKMAESVRSLLQTVAQHSKLLCAGASGRYSGLGLALVALGDVTFASESASFGIMVEPRSTGPVEPGVSVLTSYCNLSGPALNDLVVFGRRISASDALQSGLISRILWPDNFNEQVLAIAKDITAQPAQNIWLKKQMLSLKKSESESTFLKCLERERDLFVQYWTSSEGQKLLRATYNSDG